MHKQKRKPRISANIYPTGGSAERGRVLESRAGCGV